MSTPNTTAPAVDLVRRVIAISTAGVANTRNTQCDHITTALCDDGSMWELRDNTELPRWTRLPEICGGLGEIGGITASEPGCSNQNQTLDSFAMADGFESWAAMESWFQDQHGLPFRPSLRGMVGEWHSARLWTHEGAGRSRHGPNWWVQSKNPE
jgi:hypothetical protein